MEESNQPNAFVKVVTSYQHLIYGLLIGAIAVWWFGGQGGEYTGYICATSVGAFIYYETTKGKVKEYTYYDAVKEIVKQAQRGGVDLDADLRLIEFTQLGKQKYLFHFTGDHITYEFNKPLTKGVSGITRVPAETLAKVHKRRLDSAVERGINIEEITFK